MNSFYGGKNGKNFEIVKIFRSKVDLELDLQKRWQSDIAVGDFILISYGLPSGNQHDDEYNLNKEKDLAKYNKTYNSTLWQKIYRENNLDNSKDELQDIETIFISENLGLGYKLLASLTGESPSVSIKTGEEYVLHANQDPYIEVNNNDTDKPEIIFYLPRSQVLSVQNEIIAPNILNIPELIYDEADIDHPILKFKLPDSWNFILGETINLKANEKPTVNMEVLADNKTKEITFSLPEPYTVRIANYNVLNADQQPTIRLYENESNASELLLDIGIPRSQTLNQEIITQYVGSTEKPKVFLSSDVNNPQLTFSLPEAVKFHFGEDILGQSSEGTYTVEILIPEAQIGDYYIDKKTGFIYYISNISGSQTTFVFKANLSGSQPTAKTEMIKPYTPEGEKVPVEIITTYSDPEEQTGIGYTFKFPNTPNFSGNYNAIGANDTGSLETSIQNEDTIMFNFHIPSGTKWFVGSEVNDNTLNTIISGAQNGDLYLYTTQNQEDPFRGNIYQFNGSTWTKTNNNIEGPVGDSLNIINSFDYTESDGEDTLSNISSLLSNTYPTGIQKDEIIAVTYTSVTMGSISYWYYYINNQWGRVQLTGGVSGLIQNNYDNTNSTTKTYSSAYLNKLIQNEVLPSDVEKKTYTAKAIDEKTTVINNDITALKEKDEQFNQKITNIEEDIANINVNWQEIPDATKGPIFSIKEGTSTEFETIPITNGTLYFISDKKTLYIDYNDTRSQVSGETALKLINSEGNKELTVDTIFSTSDLIPLSNGGTGANSADKARENLNIYSKTEVNNEVTKASTVAYTATLSPASWVTINENEYSYNYSNIYLTCGKDGNVPPLINFTTNEQEYNYIYDADATAKSGIIFKARKKPTNLIGIVVIDLK